MNARSQDSWQRLELLFHRALELSPERRSELFDSEEVEDELRREVEALLACEARGDDAVAEALLSLGHESSRLAQPEAFPLIAATADTDTSTAPAAAIDEAATAIDETVRFGPYRLLQEIGRGGLGTVYLAERDDGQFERRVAVKVVRRDLSTQRLLEDLRLERQILARLEHPNIARLYDGGSGPAQQPYLAMEYVDGSSIDRHCRTLGLEARLELFLQVCSAVAYAHGSLIIHRDIKPSNILVTEDGVAKLLDFGIARFLEGHLSETQRSGAPLAASPRRPLFTPDFASPEQIAGEPLTTATDVYSLGVVLYRLLSGRPPYVMSTNASPTELRSALLDPLPVSMAAATEEQPWASRLRGDLDAIVAAAMAIDREERYSSVRELANDLRRHLAHRLVSVRQPSAGYRLGLFLRRYRLVASAAVIVVAALSWGLVATSWSLHRTQQAQSTAEAHLADLTREQQRSRQLIESFVSTFRLADPGQAQGETISVRELIDRSTSTLNSSEADPELAAYLAATFGEVYLNVGSPAKAEALLKRSLEGAVSELPREHFIPWRTRSLLAESQIDQGDFQAAAEQLERDIRQHRQEVGHGGASLARLVHSLGVTKLHAAEHAAAASLFRQALRMHLEDGTEASLEIAESRHRLAQALMKSGDLETSEQILQSVLEFRHQRLGPSHPTSLTTLGDLAAVALFRDDNASAARLYTRVLEGQRAIFGPDHPHVAVALQNLAVAERRLGHRNKALDHLTESVAVRRRIHGQNHPAVADALYGLARFHHQGGELDDAEPLYTEALEIRRRELGDQHPHTTMALLGVADLAWSRDQPGRAEPLYREVIRRLETSGRAETFDATFAYLQLGSLLLRADEPEAETWLHRAYQLRRQLLGEAHSATAAAHRKLAECRLRFPTAGAAGTNDPAPPLPS